MRDQWDLQRLIMARYRELGILGHQPAFQGNAPWALAGNWALSHISYYYAIRPRL